jgi:hypothetical protein
VPKAPLLARANQKVKKFIASLVNGKIEVNNILNKNIT